MPITIASNSVVRHNLITFAAVMLQHLACVLGRKDRLDPRADVVSKQADRSRRSDGSQVPVADAVLSDTLLQCQRQALHIPARHEPFLVEGREGTTLLCQLHAGPVGSDLQFVRPPCGSLATGRCVIAFAHHGECRCQARHAQA